jgi:hypothetical protein
MGLNDFCDEGVIFIDMTNTPHRAQGV